MRTHNTCFHGEKKNVETFWLKKVPYLELCKFAGDYAITQAC